MYVQSDDPNIWFAWIMGIRLALGCRSPECRRDLKMFDEWLEESGHKRIEVSTEMTPSEFAESLTRFAEQKFGLTPDKMSIHPYVYDYSLK